MRSRGLHAHAELALVEERGKRGGGAAVDVAHLLAPQVVDANRVGVVLGQELLAAGEAKVAGACAQAAQHDGETRTHLVARLADEEDELARVRDSWKRTQKGPSSKPACSPP